MNARERTRLPYHPITELFPRPSAEELEALVKSVRETRGVLQPAVTWRGQLIDGRSRYEACEKLGIECPTVEWNGIDPWFAVQALNLRRRHLSADQVAAILKLAAERYPDVATPIVEARGKAAQRRKSGKGADGSGGRGRKKTSPPRDGKASHVTAGSGVAASLVDVSPRTIDRLDQLERIAGPEAVEKVARGEARAAKLIREARREQRLEATKNYRPPAGIFPVIVVDPPWPYDEADCDASAAESRGGTHAAMTVEQIKALAVPAAPDSILWLWTPNALMRQAHEVARAWGFVVKTILTWVRPRLELGRWLRSHTEHCLLAVRGAPFVDLNNQSTLLEAPEHERSRKPDQFYALVEGLCPTTPRLELFARGPRAGWTTVGAELPCSSPSLEPARPDAIVPADAFAWKECS